MANNLQKFAIVTTGVVIGGVVIAAGLVIAAVGVILAPIVMLIRKKSRPVAEVRDQQEEPAPTNAIDATFERLDK